MIARIGIVANLEKHHLREALESCLRACETAGIQCVAAAAVAETLGLTVESAPERELHSQVDALVSFGGDGTFLHAARLVGASGTPLLGINLGSLGFLAEVTLEEIPEAMAALRAGEFRLEKRRKVAVQLIRDEEKIFENTALNDVVLNMGPVLRAIDLEIRIDESHVGRYMADGLIVSSPTGSTAYNLSAGGPIVDPEVDAVVVTPICPHTLGVRPMIIDRRRPIEVRLLHCHGGVVTADGEANVEVQAGDRLLFPRTPDLSYFIRLPRRNMFRIIRNKLNWGGPQRSMDEELSEDEAEPIGGPEDGLAGGTRAR